MSHVAVSFSLFLLFFAASFFPGRGQSSHGFAQNQSEAVIPRLGSVSASSFAKSHKALKGRTSGKRTVSVPLDKMRITSKFGPRRHPVLKRKSFHSGVDLAARLNDNVKAISDGVVVHSGKKGALGNAVFVSHPKLKVTSIYGHLNKVAVSKGDRISRGAVIGYAGTTGRSTGVHLHLTLKDEQTGTNIEPTRFLASIVHLPGVSVKSTNGALKLAAANSASNYAFDRQSLARQKTFPERNSRPSNADRVSRAAKTAHLTAITKNSAGTERSSRRQVTARATSPGTSKSAPIRESKPVVASSASKRTPVDSNAYLSDANFVEMESAMRKARQYQEWYSEGIVSKKALLNALSDADRLQKSDHPGES